MMINKKKVDNFYQKWGIEIPTQVDFKALQVRVLNCVVEDLSSIAGYNDFKAACGRVMGIPREDMNAVRGDVNFPEFLYTAIKSQQTVPALMHSLQLLLWSLLESNYRTSAEKLARHLTTILAFSPGVEADILIADDITIYPAGAKLLDDKAVKETLEWLSQYPHVGKHFLESLKIYAGKEVTRYRNLLDNLRFSLEEMLRSVLGNQKSLENQKDEALRWLASHKIHNHIVSMYSDLITKFALYQNDAVKHHERYSPAEIEFMIYLTGTFLRFLVQLDKEIQKTTP
ncbi:MAG TPA: hypothetical protein VFR24_18525 [Candidatus Angelobacter sp.]|nr:hypothetical protein [Candidatus Angelobacter sp.]